MSKKDSKEQSIKTIMHLLEKASAEKVMELLVFIKNYLSQ